MDPATIEVEFEFLNPNVGAQGKLFKSTVNLLEIRVKLPAGYNDALMVRVIHEAHDKIAASDPNLVQFCNMTIVDQGANIPCVDPLEDVDTDVSVINATLLFPK